MPLPDGLIVFRALLSPDWMDEQGEPTLQAFLPNERDKDWLSLLGSDRIVPGDIPAWLVARRAPSPVGVAYSAVGQIRQFTGIVTGLPLDVVRTEAEEADPTDPHCSLVGLRSVPKKKDPTEDQIDDALNMVEIFHGIPWR